MKRRNAETEEGIALLDLPNSALIEIVLWLIPEPPSVPNIRDLFAVKRTCKRLAVISGAPEIWSRVDVGWLAEEVPVQRREAVVAALLASCAGQITFCSCLTDLKTSVSPAHVLAMLLAMPRLRSLGVTLAKEAKCESPALLATPVAVANAAMFCGPITPERIQRAVERLSDLTTLRLDIRVDSRLLVAMKFPPALATLDINATACSTLFRAGKGPFASIRELTLSNLTRSGITGALRACSSITSLRFFSGNATLVDSDFEMLWKSCTKLRSLEVVTEAGCRPALAGFFTAACLPLLRRVTCVGNTDDQDVCDALCKYCPNIEELKLWTCLMRPENIWSLCALKNLTHFSVKLHLDSDPDAMAAAFSNLGLVDGARFKSIELAFGRFDPTGFFSGPRCSALVCLKLTSCAFAEEAGRALGRNVIATLSSVECSLPEGLFLAGLLSHQSQIVHTVIDDGPDELLSRIGATGKAPLKYVEIRGKTNITSDAGLQALAPALGQVQCLQVRFDSTSKTITPAGILSLVSACPMIQMLEIPAELHKTVAPLISGVILQ